jgi:hypothetical protein
MLQNASQALLLKNGACIAPFERTKHHLSRYHQATHLKGTMSIDLLEPLANDAEWSESLLELCRQAVRDPHDGSSINNDKCLQLAQPPKFAATLSQLLRSSVRFFGRRAARSSPQHGTWHFETHEASKRALVTFLSQRVTPALKTLFLRVGHGEPRLGDALQTLHSDLLGDAKNATTIAGHLAATLRCDDANDDDGASLFDHNCALLATPTRVHERGERGQMSERKIVPADLVSRTLTYELAPTSDIDSDRAALEALETTLCAALRDDAAVRSFLMQALATMAFPRRDTNANVFVLLGESGSGKSALVALLKHLFGAYAVPLPEALLYGKTVNASAARAALAGARIAYVDDPTASFSVELLKRLTNSGSEGGHCCHIVIAAQEAQFRTVFKRGADMSIGSRVSVLTLPKRFVPPCDFSEANSDKHPLASSASALDDIVRAGAPLLMHKLLYGSGDSDALSAVAECQRRYETERSLLPRCKAVLIDTQRLLEPESITVRECVAKWLYEVLRAPALLERDSVASVNVSVLLAHYKQFVAERRANKLVVPPKDAASRDEVVAVAAAADAEPANGGAAQLQVNSKNEAQEANGARRKRNQRDTGVEAKRKKTSTKAKKDPFLIALESMNMRVEQAMLIGYRWTAAALAAAAAVVGVVGNDDDDEQSVGDQA